jgi:hypothetical protein
VWRERMSRIVMDAASSKEGWTMEERATPAGTSQDGREMRRFWFMGGALLLTVLLAVLLAARPAEAEPRIKVSGCNVYATNRVDPIAFSQHLHHHFGNTTTTNASTGQSLLAAKTTSCKASWFTSAGWFPVAQNVPLVSKNQVAVYYRAPGDRTKVKDIPTGLGIVSHEVHLNSGGSTVTVTFPDCWDQKSLNPANMVKSRNGVCPSTHPYRIPRVFYLIRYNGIVTSQTLVSSGVDSWAPFGIDMHADYLAANQQPVFNDLIELCLRDAVAAPACG